RRTSLGDEIGWRLAKRWLKPCSNDPSEKATLANRAVEMGRSRLSRIRNISMIRLLAPIMFTGLAALSVDTQKYLRAPAAFDCAIVATVFSTLTSISRINVNGSFSLRTCFSAD